MRVQLRWVETFEYWWCYIFFFIFCLRNLREAKVQSSKSVHVQFCSSTNSDSNQLKVCRYSEIYNKIPFQLCWVETFHFWWSYSNFCKICLRNFWPALTKIHKSKKQKSLQFFSSTNTDSNQHKLCGCLVICYIIPFQLRWVETFHFWWSYSNFRNFCLRNFGRSMWQKYKVRKSLQFFSVTNSDPNQHKLRGCWDIYNNIPFQLCWVETFYFWWSYMIFFIFCLRNFWTADWRKFISQKNQKSLQFFSSTNTD